MRLKPAGLAAVISLLFSVAGGRVELKFNSGGIERK
jgi:hypothetical protein